LWVLSWETGNTLFPEDAAKVLREVNVPWSG